MAIPEKPGKTVRFARRLRRAMSLTEVILWERLRRHSGGFRFRRQHPAGAYVLDFYCAEARLCVEVDSEAHSRGDRPERDLRRDEFLAQHGVATLRISATDVLENLEGVLMLIVAEARARLPLHHPAAPGGPPPQA